MLNEIALGVSQHLLREAQWARKRLAEHAGKQVRVEFPLGTMLLQIAADGDVEHGEPANAPDLVIRMSPLAAARWLTDRQTGWREARVDGDMELAAAISHVMANLRWDYEEDLSQVVGDVAAHRIARGIHHLSAWPADAAQRAHARSISAEMHAGFPNLRQHMSMNIRKRHPGTGIVILSQYDDPEYAISLLEEGAAGYAYLLKDRVADVSEFIEAVDRVARGGTALDPEVIAQVMARRRREDP